MEFLIPYMKNRPTVGHPVNSQESQIEIEESSQSDPPSVETNYDEASESIEAPKAKITKKTPTADTVLRKFIADSNNRAAQRDEIRQNLRRQAEQEQSLAHDPLYQFFLSMCNITRGLPAHFQREVRRKVFEAVSQAEEDAENDTRKVQINSEFSSSTSTSASTTQDLLVKRYPQFFGHTQSPRGEEAETSWSGQEESSSYTLTNL